MQVEVFNWKKNQPLAEDYIHHPDRMDVLFESHFKDENSWDRRVKWLMEAQSPQADRNGLVQSLATYNRLVGNSSQALESINLLHDRETLVVVGGQQAGLFGGPLLVVYKAITLLQLARQMSRKLKRQVIPVFWIAGEDHDFDEVNHIHYLSAKLSVEKLKVEHPTGQRNSVSRLPLSAHAWRDAIEALEATWMDTEFKGALLQKLNDFTAEASTLSIAFARIMAMLFGEYGLVLMDSDDPNIRRLEAPMFEQLIKRNPELAAAFMQGAERVEAAGYTPQAEVSLHAANLFVFEGEQRLLLHREEQLYMDKKREYTYSKENLLERSRTSPELLSNNVMTRPLMQEYLFPVLSTVLGPGEIAYWALTKDAFRLFGMQMPIIAPRLEFTLLESAVIKHMDKYELTLDDVIYRFEDKKQAWLNAQDTLKLSEQFDEVRTKFLESYRPLIESLSAIHSGIKKLGDTNLDKILEQINYLETKASDAHKTNFDSSLRQFDRIQLSITPLAKPQERVYNVCAYLNRYGDRWLRQLIEDSIPVDGLHRVYYL
jgi:bacillithiol biosynthesis cysteine-adding enzyme BshC